MNALRRRVRQRLIIAAGAACALAVNGGAFAEEDAFLAALSARDALKSGRVVIESTLSYPLQSDQQIRVEYELVFDGGSIRESETVPSAKLDGVESGPGRRVESRHAGREIHGYVIPGPDGKPLVVQSTAAGKILPQLLDPRVFGLLACATAHLHNQSVEAVRRRHGQFALKMSDDVVDGEPCTRIEYQREADGARLRTWIAAGLGFNVLRAEIAARYQDEDLVDSLHCRIKEWPQGEGGKVWFPEEVIFDRRSDGKHLIHEVSRVTAAEFNIPVDGKEFGPEGLSLLPGTILSEIGTGKAARTEMWDGSKMVPFKPPIMPLESVAPPRSRPWKWLISVNLAALAIICFAMWAWRRSIPPSGDAG